MPKHVPISGQIFDPVESQIIGNMYCANDTTEQVFGYFGASSVQENSGFIHLDYNNKVRNKNVIYFPELDRNLLSNSPPDFWVFYMNK